MKNYQNLLKKIMDEGIDKSDRTGVGTRSIFGTQLRFDLTEGFPLLTTKKVFMKGIIYELLWFLAGDTNIRYLCQNGVKIWNEWPYQKYLEENNLTEKYPKYSDERKEYQKEFVQKIIDDDEFANKRGELGPVYGHQWRNFNGEGVDQISNVINTLKNNPNSRRIMVVAYNPVQVKNMALPPCHSLFQFYVANNRLSCQLYQRSCDTFLGLPFNIASYSLLTMMIAQVVGMDFGNFVRTGGDTHIYSNHFEQVKEQLSRETRQLPTMKINPEVKNIFDFKYEDFTLENYDPHPAIKAPIAV